jgi:hypothetical protein
MKGQAEQKIENESATDRLKELETKLQELRAERTAITSRLTEAAGQDRVEALLRGEDVDQVIGAGAPALEVLDRKIHLLEIASRRQAGFRDRAKALAGRAERDRMRPAWEGHLREYHAAIRSAADALRGISTLNAELNRQGFSPFPTIPFPGVRLTAGNFDRQERLFLDICKMHGVNIE